LLQSLNISEVAKNIDQRLDYYRDEVERVDQHQYSYFETDTWVAKMKYIQNFKSQE